MLGKVFRASGASLVLFHVWLFAGQAWEGALADPTLLARWFAAGSLIWAVVSLRRRGHPIGAGRRAVAVWLLAALLHGPAIAQRLDTTAPPPPEVVSTLAQIAGGATALAGILLLAGLLTPFVRRPLGAASGFVLRTGPNASSQGFDWRAFARPPPLT